MAILNLLGLLTEIACFFIGLFCLYKDESLAWRLFIWFLLINCLLEAGSRYAVIYYKSNAPLINIYHLPEAIFMSLIFAQLLSEYRKMKITIIAGLVLILLVFCTEVVTRPIRQFFTWTTFAVSAMFILYSVYYFYLLYRSGKKVNIWTYPPFWWTMSTFLYYLGTTISYTMLPLKYEHYTALYVVYNLLGIFLYGSWSYAFIRKRQVRRQAGISPVSIPELRNELRTSVYDFFIAHASEQVKQAETLYDYLCPPARVFLDSRSLRLADIWSDVIMEAQLQSMFTVVLVSADTENAYYQREEIATAIQMARERTNNHKVIPVFLVNNNLDKLFIPYGLRIIHGVYVNNNRQMKTAAEKMLALLNEMTR